ncbi:MAG: hypothetical protein AAGF95_20525 [Chloroflexota bacterium]
MAEADTILQLGIAAAREGNREEARNLFSLLTRQEPDNVQAWLWLAGVAEGPDERRAALERVVELDPTNEMAIKGLRAMGVTPQTTKADDPDATPPAETAAPAPAPPPPRQDLSEEEMYAAELDAAFDDYDTVAKEAPPPRNDPTPIRSGDYDMDSAATGAAGATARERVENRRSSRRGLSPLVIGLIALILVCLIGTFFLTRGSDEDPVATGDGTATVEPNGENQGAGIPADATATAEAGAEGEGTPPENGQLGAEATPEGEGTPPEDGGTPPEGEGTPPEGEGTPPEDGGTPPEGEGTPPEDGGTPPEGEGTPPEDGGTPPEGEGTPPAEAPTDMAGVRPELVPVATILESNGWSYAFPGNCFGGCGALVGPQIGGFTAQGNYLVILLQVANGTGTPQPIPADFFVLTDAQGQAYNPLPDVSAAYVIPGVNADLSMQSTVPANGVLTSIALVFDVPSGATDLLVFARSNTNQSWLAFNAVP